MKILIFGATGGTGRAMVEQALEQGHQVTAFVRNPSKLAIKDAKLSVIQGDAMNPSQVEEAVKGQDAVISALGVSRGAPLDICSRGTKNIIEAMKKHSISRLVVESAYGTRETRKGFYAKSLWIMIRDRIQDKELMEKLIEESGLDWIISRPVWLTSGPKRGNYRHGINLSVKFWPTVSRADVADFMIKQLQDKTYLHKMPIVTY
jgi:putative NADH-flavin reductase